MVAQSASPLVTEGAQKMNGESQDIKHGEIAWMKLTNGERNTKRSPLFSSTPSIIDKTEYY
jgi:hypothetical protein